MSDFGDSLELLTRAFTASSIMTSPLLCVDKGVEIESILEIAKSEKMNYEVLGYREDGKVVGTTRRDDLEKGIAPEEKYYPLTDGLLIPDTASLIDTFRKLSSAQFLLVNSHKGIVGMITAQDLEKRPMRLLLFAAVSELERLFLQRIRELYENNEARLRAHLSEAQVEGLEERYKQKHGANDEISYFDCLNTSDIYVIVAGEPSISSLIDPEIDFKKKYGFLPNFRNQIVHPNESYSKNDARKLIDRWDRILKAVQRLN